MARTPSDEARKYFESLYKEYCQRVLAYCTRRTDSVDAADVCSETFLVVWRRLDEVPRPPETLPYIYGIARKQLTNQLRTAHRRSRLEAKLHSLGVANAPDPATFVVQTARNREVVTALRKLKPKDREIVMLYLWEELPHAVIAQMMGMTKTAVDQRIHRSYQRLERILLEPVPDTPRPNSPPVAEKGGT